MVANVLLAMLTLAKEKYHQVDERPHSYGISINSVGAGFETFVKDILTGKFYGDDSSARESAYKEHFSYSGSQNKAIDAIVKMGDAFEIKKVELREGQERIDTKIALNNSYPKALLYPDDEKTLKMLRGIDGGNWEQKDIFYVIGGIGKKDHLIKQLYFVQGVCYSANRELYEVTFESVRKAIENALNNEEFSELEFKRTKELGRIYHVDPLKITDFRMRGMWELASPDSVFMDVVPIDVSKKFNAYAIMEKSKFEELSNQYVLGENLGDSLTSDNSVEVTEGTIKNPSKLSESKQVKVVKVSW